jgi:hypothetical protein
MAAMSQQSVTIIDRRTGQPVNAVLHRDLSRLQLIDVEIDWAPERLRLLKRRLEEGAAQDELPQHAHWNWAAKALEYAELPSYRCLGIEAESKMQGLTIVSISGTDRARLPPDAGKPLIYVEFLETAPWNAGELMGLPSFKGVGRALLKAVVRLSADSGFDGRLGLHSLAQSTDFYSQACGMTALGPDPSTDNFEYFELTALQAAQMIRS